MYEKIVRENFMLTQKDFDRLKVLDQNVETFAQLTQSDIFVDCFVSDKEGVVISHGRPEKSLYQKNIEGEKVMRRNEPTVFYTRETGVGMNDAYGISQENVRIQQRTSPIFGDNGEVIAVLIQESDVTDRAKLNNKLTHMATVTEMLSSQELIKEGIADINSTAHGDNILLQEAHHRIKNNLQIISSILNMQRRRSKNFETREILTDNISRLNSLASMHETMMTASGEKVEICEVLEKQIHLFEQIHRTDDRKVQFNFEGMSLCLSFEKAQAVSMIVNELMVNAMKHGVANADCGEIPVRLVVGENRATIIVSNGINPHTEKTFEDCNSYSGFGLDIVRELAKDKLKGTYSLQRTQNGTAAIISFPI